MKAWYDHKAVVRHFKVGDKVLVLLPILGSALQARYSGPYEIKHKVSDCDCNSRLPPAEASVSC